MEMGLNNVEARIQLIIQTILNSNSTIQTVTSTIQENNVIDEITPIIISVQGRKIIDCAERLTAIYNALIGDKKRDEQNPEQDSE